MNAKPNIAISERARTLAEQRSREEGFDSTDAYVEALISEDASYNALPDWLRRRLEEGLQSPSAGELTEKRIAELIDEGVTRVQRRK
jgi:hypothetical protein